MGPRWAQEGPESPEEAQDGAKMGPRWVREPRTGPRWAQDGPKKGPRWAQDGPKIGLTGLLKTEAEKRPPPVKDITPFGAILGPSWGPLGALLGPLRALLGSSSRLP